MAIAKVAYTSDIVDVYADIEDEVGIQEVSYLNANWYWLATKEGVNCHSSCHRHSLYYHWMIQDV